MSQKERRNSKRREIVESFSMFVVVPKRGFHKLPLHDLSETGIGFNIDIEDEDIAAHPLASGEEFEIYLYLNQTLHLPLKVKIARIVDQQNGVRKVGAEFQNKNGKGYKALQPFINVLDVLSESGELD